MSQAHHRRTLALIAFAAIVLSLPVAPGVFAAKRRAVRSPSNGGATGPCHTFGLVRAGLKATYLTTASTGDVNFTVTYISDTPTQTKTTQKVSTAQGLADADTTIDTEVVNGLRATKHVEVLTSITVPGVGTLVTEVDMDYVPSTVFGPAGAWCAGATWTVSSSTLTTTTRTSLGGTQAPIVTTTPPGSGAVLAVGERLTVPAGTFETVKYRGVVTTDTGISPAIVWMGMQDSITIRQDALDAFDNVISTTTLTALQ